MLVRREVLAAFGFNEDLAANEDWDVCLRAVAAGHRIIVTNAVQLYRREKPGRHATTVLLQQDRQLQYHDVLRQQHISVGQRRVPLYAVRAGALVTAGGVSESAEALRTRVEMYEHSRVVFFALALERKLRKTAPWAVRLAGQAAAWAWHLRNKRRRS